MKNSLFQRVGAFGAVAALSLGGGGMFVRSCAPPKPVLPISTPLAVSSEIVRLVNVQRVAAGMAPVAENAALDAAATGHSQDQARRHVMTHTGSNGSTAGQRITASGYAWKSYGENVAAGWPDTASVFNAWMNSAGHRANILHASFTDVGVAAVTANNGVIYWTMDLASHR
jgi:uncharacterized protein YkwD